MFSPSGAFAMGGKCYSQDYFPKNHQDARQSCDEAGMMLAMFKKAADLGHIMSLKGTSCFHIVSGPALHMVDFCFAISSGDTKIFFI